MNKLKNVNGGELKTIEQVLSETLRARRDMLGLSQEGVAKRLKIARSTLSHYEHGKRSPTLKQFIVLCDVLYLDVATIINEATVEL